MKQQINSIADFVEACKSLDSNGIYELFEFELSEDVRSQIYALADDKEAYEPVRRAMQLIGARYNVQSLIDY